MKLGFNRLLDELEMVTRHLSSPTLIQQVPQYEDVIDYLRVSPLSLEEVIKRIRQGDGGIVYLMVMGEHTGAQPVPRESAGKVNEMAQAWLAWADANFKPGDSSQ